LSEDKVYKGREASYQVLHRVLHGGAYSNLVITSAFEKEDMSPDERRVVLTLVYGVLRNLTLLDEVFRSKAKKGKLTVAPALLLLGRMAIYEMLFQTKTPVYASASEYVKMARARCSVPEAKFLNAVLRHVNQDDRATVLEAAPNREARIALEFSHPEWFVHSAIASFGMADCMKMLRAHNTGMPSYFRVNTSKVSVKEIMDIFRSFRLEVDKIPNLPTCIYFRSGQNFFPSKEFEAGWVTPQDYSTQLVAHILAPKPGESVLDLCCGRGTKATHAAEIMGGRGRVVACDIYDSKIQLLEAEKQRLGFDFIEARAVDVTEGPDLGEFDRVLLDAPCSGTGTFRRRPELKQRITVESLRNLIKLQRKLLGAAAGYVRPGGRLVYATCSVLQEENDDVVEHFLAAHDDFSVDRRATAASKLPASRTLFGRVFLPHQTQACSMAVSILKRNA